MTSKFPSSVYALIPAAGSSSRLGLGYSKALLRVGDRTVIERAVSAILSSEMVNSVVILIRREDMPSFKTLPLDWSRVTLIEGGAARQESVRAGLDYLERNKPDIASSLVLVHDAARCFASPELVRRSIEGAFRYQAVTAAIPVVDSIKQVSSEGLVEASLPREKLVAVQTPQVFSFSLLSRAHREGAPGATDDASLVERIHPVRVVHGERTNIKVTNPEDVAVAELIARS